MADQVNVVGEYMNNRHWNELVFRDSRERFADLRSWGVQFLEKDGEVVRLPHPYKNIELPDKDKFPPIVSEVVHWLPGFPEILRKHLIRSGVKLKDRFMVTELLKQEDRVVGAIGFSIEGNEPQVIKAKAVAMCAGGGGFRPIGYPTHEMTADGHVMAYRVGATITSKEFVAPHSTDPEQPAWPPMYLFFSSGGSAALPGMYQVPKLFNAEGDAVPARGMAWHGWIDAEYEAHEGRAPLIADLGRRGVHPVSGPARTARCSATRRRHRPGGRRLRHAASPDSTPRGTAAAPASSARRTRASASPPCTRRPRAPAPGSAPPRRPSAWRRRRREAPASTSGSWPRRRRACSSRWSARAASRPHWVTQVLQNTLAPYFVLYIKHGDRLQTALSTVEYLRDHIVPKLYARDDHELRLAHETKNMVTSAEMKLRSSLFRTESRGTHYREDYPGRNDAEWLAWVRLKEEDGGMKAFKEPIPAEWRPDAAKPYEERYPMRLPNESPGGGAGTAPRGAGAAGNAEEGGSHGHRSHRSRALQRLRHLRAQLPHGRHPHGPGGPQGRDPLSEGLHALRPVPGMSGESHLPEAGLAQAVSAGLGVSRMTT